MVCIFSLVVQWLHIFLGDPKRRERNLLRISDHDHHSHNQHYLGNQHYQHNHNHNNSGPRACEWPQHMTPHRVNSAQISGNLEICNPCCLGCVRGLLVKKVYYYVVFSFYANVTLCFFVKWFCIPLRNIQNQHELMRKSRFQTQANFATLSHFGPVRTWRPKRDDSGVPKSEDPGVPRVMIGILKVIIQ